jgi:hypothetical protein
MSRRACVEISFRLAPLSADHHGLVTVAFDQDSGEHAAQVAFLLELLDQDGAGVWQFFTDETEHFLAHDLSRREIFRCGR